MQTQKPQSVQDLKLDSEHVCVLHRSDEERWSVVSSIVQRSLENGERILYVANRSTAEASTCLLRESIPPLSFYIAGNHFKVVTAQNAYLPGGSFEPSKVIARVERETDDALSAGYKSLRLIADMGWVLDKARGSELFLKFESMLDDIAQSGGLHVVCLYSTRSFTAPILLHALAAHRSIHFGSKAYQNPFFGAPPDSFYKGSAISTLSRWLEQISGQNMSDSVCCMTSL